MRRHRPRPTPLPAAQIPGQLPLFDEENETGPATTAGPAPGEPATHSPATDTQTPRTESP